jgi:DNA-binding protein H-NS
MKVWEEHLFKKIDNDKERNQLRKQKEFQIIKLETKNDILEEIGKTFQVLEAKRQKEQEEKEKELRKKQYVASYKQIKITFNFTFNLKSDHNILYMTH